MESLTLKKGWAISSAVIVTIVLALFAFFAGWKFVSFFGETASLQNREVCHISILERATVPGVLQQAVPLQCNAEKICITTDKKNKCKQFTGEEGIRYVELDMPTGIGAINLAKEKEIIETIEREMANAMYDCWAMTGEGKLDIFAKGEKGVVGIATELATDNVLDVAKPKCIVCSRVAISDDVYVKDGEYIANRRVSLGQAPLQGSPPLVDGGILGQIDLNSFMATENIPNTDIKYIEAFSGEDGARGYGELVVTEKNESEQDTEEQLNASEIAFIFMQIKVTDDDAKEIGWDAFGDNLLIGGAALLTTQGSVWNKAASKIGGVPFNLFKIVGVGAISAGFAYTTYQNVEKSQAIAAAACDNLETTNKAEGTKGCSIVRAVKWDVSTVNDLCDGGIEGNI